jgi:outer membrane receptor protein involved in Fe transport
VDTSEFPWFQPALPWPRPWRFLSIRWAKSRPRPSDPFTTAVRVRYRIAKQWSAAFGIDNLNNYKYWNFHPYPQRSYSAELKFDL